MRQEALDLWRLLNRQLEHCSETCKLDIIANRLAAAHAKGMEEAASIAWLLSTGWDGVSAVAANEVAKEIRSRIKDA